MCGLPGGHMDDGESPDAAIVRELSEELGLDDVALERGDFWMHGSGKLVLGYVGSIDESTVFTLQEDELIEARWVPVEDLRNGTLSLGDYSDFVIVNAAG